ncbi:hypothetical protein [Streptomyces sp. KL118A]|uniref:hypothetical protein n=1 Tax=Streptomyces sp. KL118A TaxID=3045153 RepID=UPI00278C75DC|nr:hypothetical protein [Streptomyces sp. KL118A]
MMKTDEQRPVTGYDRRMYAIMNRREGASLHATAARRRAVVVTHIVLTAAGIACWLYSVLGDERWATVGILGVLLPWCVATGVINGATRGLLELRARVLDERQRAEKNRVAARAQYVMMWLLLSATVLVGGLGLAGVEIEGLIFPVLFSVFVVHWLMPLWLAGLAAADEPADDTEDGPEGDLTGGA